MATSAGLWPRGEAAGSPSPLDRAAGSDAAMAAAAVCLALVAAFAVANGLWEFLIAFVAVFGSVALYLRWPTAGLTAVLGQLLVMNGERDLEFDPERRCHRGRVRLLREFTQNGATLLHDLAGSRHLRFELGVVGGQSVAVGSFGQVDRVALVELQAGQDFLGEDDPGRVANGGELEFDHGSTLLRM